MRSRLCLAFAFICAFCAAADKNEVEHSNPQTSIEGLYPDTAADRKELIRIYELGPARWKRKQLLPFAISYAIEGKWEKAEKLYKDYLSVAKNDRQALRGLGNCYFFQKDYNKAIRFYKKAWDLNDVDALRQLAFTYYGTGKTEMIAELVPGLLMHKNDPDLSRDRQAEFATILAIFAVNQQPPDKALFYKAIDGWTDQALAEREQLASVATKGFEIFGDSARLRRVQAAP